MIDPTILAQARTARAAVFDRTCQVQRNVAGTWTTTATVACAKAARGAQGEASLAAHVRDRADWVFSLPVGTAVTPNGRVLCDGQRYRVIDPDADRTDALCRRVVAADEGAI